MGIDFEVAPGQPARRNRLKADPRPAAVERTRKPCTARMPLCYRLNVMAATFKNSLPQPIVTLARLV